MEEVENISKIIPSEIYNANMATIENFKNNYNDYDIIHLAMHTLDDNKNSSPELAFSCQQKNSNFSLNAENISNMDMDANMIVLSACNTGTGKFQTGRGVMSLARSFIYSGCNSVIMTLWSVEDRPSAVLMDNFYRHISLGYSRDEALRQAKLNYIKNADQLKSHPYFWAGYLNIGSTTPISNISGDDDYSKLILCIAFL